MKMTTVGIDWAKGVFAVPGVNGRGQIAVPLGHPFRPSLKQGRACVAGSGDIGGRAHASSRDPRVAGAGNIAFR